jgi:hypothetical protein
MNPAIFPSSTATTQSADGIVKKYRSVVFEYEIPAGKQD